MEPGNVTVRSTINDMYRIAHLSDTHISPEYNRHNIVKLRKLLSYVVDQGYDHVVMTGDISGHGEERDFRSVRRLLKYFGLLDYKKLSVTVGNHDVFGGVHRAEDLFSFTKYCRAINYDEKIRMFEQAFRETFPRKIYDAQQLFPFIKVVGPVAFVGMNSIRRFHTVLNRFGSNGYVPPEQMEAAERMLSHPSISSMKKILLIHHHFKKYEPYTDALAKKLYAVFEALTLKLEERKRVEEALRRTGVDAVLHGHTHIHEIYERSGILFSSTGLNSTRARSDTDSHENRLAFNELSILSDGEIQIRKRRLIALHTGSSYHTSDKRFQE